MIASQREALAHTDITQLLILGKSSDATDVRDMVYAFYGLTYLTSAVTYSRDPEWLFVEIIHMYLEALRYTASYDSVHGLTEHQKTYQLMSILYSAGTLHQHRILPSWVPDWYANLMIHARRETFADEHAVTLGHSHGIWPLSSAKLCQTFFLLLPKTSGHLVSVVTIVQVATSSRRSRYSKEAAVS